MKVVIVGGVAGGATCAARLRRMAESATITLYERGEFVSFANCGLPYYVGKVIAKQSDLLLASPKLFKDRFDINVAINHNVTKINRAKKEILARDLVTGKDIVDSYDYLVLSTGASPIKPNLPLKGIFSLRNIPDSEEIKSWIHSRNVKKAVIVGAGFIGLEMAESLVNIGIKVEIVEFAPQVMNVFDSEMVVGVQKHLLEKGVGLNLSEMVTAFEQQDKNIVVKTKSGISIATDMVILSIGVKPEISLAEQCGLDLGKTGGIKTNNRMQTSDPFIFAAGDSVETTDFVTKQSVIVPLAKPANRQGRVIADNISNPNTKSVYRGVQGTSICKVFDYVLACTGASEKTLNRVGMQFDKVHLYPFNHVSYYPGATRMSLKVLYRPDDGLILGAQAVGMEGIDKRIDVISMAIQARQTIHDLEEVELCYSPQFGSGKDPINVAGMIGGNALRGDQPLAHWNQINSTKDIQLLDVRNVDEFDGGHVEGAKNIPLNDLRKRMNELDQSKPVHVYCAVGQRGYYGTRLLLQHGFDARNVSGGMTLFKSLFPKL
jgi:NADPH-dependent 2,4-dienoyl-CoA reductase/sulfur reductase-like enzyme/rhodanese-related sulfurtransferase